MALFRPSMTVPIIPSGASPLILDFMSKVLWTGEGYIEIFTKTAIKPEKRKSLYFRWPDEAGALIDYVAEKTIGHNIYFGPALLKLPERKATHANETLPCCWCDLDESDPDFYEGIEPPVLLQTSQGRWQGFWPLQEMADRELVEEINLRLEYNKPAIPDERKGGWFLGKLMRLPLTYNYKYGTQPQVVELERCSSLRVPTALFSKLKPIDKLSRTPAGLDVPPMPKSGNADSARDGRTFSSTVESLLETFPESDADWSARMHALELGLFEEGVEPEDVFWLVLEAPCNKFRRDNRPNLDTWIDVLRAYRKYQADSSAVHQAIVITVGGNGHGPDQVPVMEVSEAVGPPVVITPERAEQVRAKLGETFIDRYVAWATQQTDAPRVYHEAWAFMVLSTVLSSSLRVSTSIGMMVPNLWLLLLANTTTTRKTTAMNLATEILNEVLGDDYLVATEGSQEGILTAMADRTRKASMFARDEVSGLLDQMGKREYMSGMMETLTKLYDGQTMKRVLRKDTYHIKEPVFLFYGGGPKTRTEELIQPEHITSGFLPRFIVVTADTKRSEMRPLGRMTRQAAGQRDDIIAELRVLYKVYSEVPAITVGATTTSGVAEVVADLTDAAWDHYNVLENGYVAAAEASSIGDLLIPVMDRLSKTTLKMSSLVAASRTPLPADGAVLTVVEDDVDYAAIYTQTWAEHAMRLVFQSGRSVNEKNCETVLRAIKREPGILRSTVMRRHRLSSIEIEMAIRTLEMRDQLQVSKQGKAWYLHPVS